MEGHKMNERLLAKMENEQSEFLAALIEANPIEALSMSKRYHVQEAIIHALRIEPISEKQALALLKCSRPLSSVYRHWERLKHRQQIMFLSTLEEYANHIIQLRELCRKKEGGDDE